MRSAQFGCNDLARDALRDSSIPSFRIGVVESHIVLAGMCGGLGRAVVEGPTEFFKIRQQIVAQWSYREALSGLGVTMGRNTGLFSAFVVYMDLLRPYLGDSPFVYGATCSNLAWLTVWPFDVVKTQRQSGRHPGVSAPALLANAARDGALCASAPVLDATSTPSTRRDAFFHTGSEACCPVWSGPPSRTGPRWSSTSGYTRSSRG